MNEIRDAASTPRRRWRWRELIEPCPRCGAGEMQPCHRRRGQRSNACQLPPHGTPRDRPFAKAWSREAWLALLPLPPVHQYSLWWDVPLCGPEKTWKPGG